MNIKTAYKQTEIGVIPEDWEVKKIFECTDYVDYRGKTPKKTTSGRFLVTAKNIRTGYIDYEISKEYVPEDEYISIMKRGLPLIGDIVITTEAPLGNVALIDREDIALAQRVIKYRANVNFLNYGYLKHYFLSEKFQEILDDNSSGSTAKGIKGSVLHKLPIILPPLPEQTAIAAALSDVDALMGELDKLIAKKQGIKQATMQQLLTGKKRLAGFSGEWEETKLEKFASFYKGKGLAKNEIDIYGKTPCVHYGELFTQYAESITETHSRTNLSGNVFLSKNNDVLMPTSDVTPNGLAKASCILKDDVILGGDILVIRTTPKEINGTFLSFVIRHSKEKIMQLVTGSTVYHLYASDMKNFIFLIPTLEEQTAIANILSDMDAEINALQQKHDKTAQLKAGMMQELLTGRIRLIGASA